MEKTRNISIAEFFDVLQREYLINEWRGKVYYSPKDRRYYERVCGYKRQRVEDISNRNGLKSIFNDEGVLATYRDTLFDSNGKPKFDMTYEDVRNYYSNGSDWVYKGRPYVLISVEGDSVVMKDATVSSSDMIKVDKKEIRRIF